MPIRAEDRWLYPIDWQQISEAIRFGRAGARCEQCGRPHMSYVAHLGDGRWWDAPARCWRNHRGRRVAAKGFTLATVRTTYVVLACAHLNHDPGDSSPGNLRALCQRCHIIHDAAEHRWRRWWNAYRLRALRDLYEDPQLTRERLGTGSKSRLRTYIGVAAGSASGSMPLVASYTLMMTAPEACPTSRRRASAFA